MAMVLVLHNVLSLFLVFMLKSNRFILGIPSEGNMGIVRSSLDITPPPRGQNPVQFIQGIFVSRMEIFTGILTRIRVTGANRGRESRLRSR
jgi:hypothetical protein